MAQYSARFFDRAGLHDLAARHARIASAVFRRQKLAGRLAGISRGARHLSLAVRLRDPTDLDRALALGEVLALACHAPACLAERRDGEIAYQFELPQPLWQTVTRANVQGAAVGLADGGRPVPFDFSEPHSLIGGTTGSGKSELIKSILTGLVTTQSPSDLGLLLLDPHMDLTAFDRSAHLVAPIAHDHREIERAITWAASELAERRARNQRAGRRILIACDEGPEIFGDERLLALATATARQSRKYRLSFAIGTIDNKQAALGELAGVLLNRFVGLVSDARASAQLSGHAGLNAHRLTSGGGDFLHVQGAMVQRFQAALATDADLEKIPRVVDVPALPAEVPELPDLPEEERGPGRPAVEPEAQLVAFYLHGLFSGAPASVRQAAARGITRTRHEVNREFAEEVHRFLDVYDQEEEWEVQE